METATISDYSALNYVSLRFGGRASEKMRLFQYLNPCGA